MDGDFITSQGEVGDSFFMLEEGMVTVTKRTQQQLDDINNRKEPKSKQQRGVEATRKALGTAGEGEGGREYGREGGGGPFQDPLP